jgi:hypothetical protein
MGIDYKIVCEECEVSADSEIHNYIREGNYYDICNFLNYHGIQGHAIKMRDERDEWDDGKYYPKCKKYDAEYHRIMDGECEDITNKRALPKLDD